MKKLKGENVGLVFGAFKWRTNHGVMLLPSEMETRHLYLTLRMIWNHSVPDRYQIHPFKRYTFSAFYTKQYLAQAVRELGRELLSRNNLQGRWELELARMAEFLNSAESIRLIAHE